MTLKEALTELSKILRECHGWLTEHRQRLHHPICTVHKPDARCSCGLHGVMSRLSLTAHDLDNLKPEINVGTLEVGVMANGNIWIGRQNSEGAEFSVKAVEQCLTEFYDKNF